MRWIFYINLMTGCLLVALGILSFISKVTEFSIKKESFVYFVEFLMVVFGLFLIFMTILYL